MCEDIVHSSVGAVGSPEASEQQLGEVEQNPLSHPISHISASFRKVVNSMWMSEAALDAWERLHVQTQGSIVWFFSAALLAIILDVLLLLCTPITSYVEILRYFPLISLSISSLYTCFFWRMGPHFASLRGVSPIPLHMSKKHYPRLQLSRGCVMQCSVTRRLSCWVSSSITTLSVLLSPQTKPLSSLHWY
jgi:hypothetical protein